MRKSIYEDHRPDNERPNFITVKNFEYFNEVAHYYCKYSSESISKLIMATGQWIIKYKQQ